MVPHDGRHAVLVSDSIKATAWNVPHRYRDKLTGILDIGAGDGRALHIFQGAAARWADRRVAPARGAWIETMERGADPCRPHCHSRVTSA